MQGLVNVLIAQGACGFLSLDPCDYLPAPVSVGVDLGFGHRLASSCRTVNRMGINDFAMKGTNRGEMAVSRYTAEQIAEQLAPKLDALVAEQKRTNQLLEWLGGVIAKG